MNLPKRTFKNKWDNQKGRCFYCGKPLINAYHCEGGNINIDHIKPFSKSRDGRVSNLCLACKKCNNKKNNYSIEEFRSLHPECLFYEGEFYFEFINLL